MAKAKERRMVEFGYQEQELDVKHRGTLLVLDAFDDFEADDLTRIFQVAAGKHFAKVVLVPHNEKTLKTMGLTEVQAFHKRVKLLEALLEEVDPDIPVHIDRYEEKRKKYTPMELLLRYFEETYNGPYFLYISERYANVFATFASFDECMRKIRLIVDRGLGDAGGVVHPKLRQVENRWESVG